MKRWSPPLFCMSWSCWKTKHRRTFFGLQRPKQRHANYKLFRATIAFSKFDLALLNFQAWCQQTKNFVVKTLDLLQPHLGLIFLTEKPSSHLSWTWITIRKLVSSSWLQGVFAFFIVYQVFCSSFFFKEEKMLGHFHFHCCTSPIINHRPRTLAIRLEL